jgi:tetratricopeptide (TPR) repeat protein
MNYAEQQTVPRTPPKITVQPRLTFALAVVLACVCSYLSLAAQTRSSGLSGEEIYKQSSASVFLLEVYDASGTQVGSGSGFLVSEDQIVTNAHVADAGSLQVRLGPIQVPCTVERADRVNDLALCRIPARSSARILSLAGTEPAPGSTVYAIGSPRGLENTITEGLFTGYREVEGRKLAQLSAAISPGSSGGPILNSAGELVGVVVGTLTQAQNVNFAVPLPAVRRFIRNETVSESSSFVEQAKQLQAQRNQQPYSGDRNSAYQKLDQQFRDVVLNGIAGASDPDVLLSVYELSGIGDANLQAAAARRAIAITKPPRKEFFTKLAQALYYESLLSDTKTVLKEAEEVATKALSLGRPQLRDLSLLGDIQLSAGNYSVAHTTYVKASSLPGDSSDQASVFYSLFIVCQELNRSAEAESWFKRIDRDTLEAYQWSSYGKFLDDQARYNEAANAYLTAYNKATFRYSDLCEAGVSFYFGGRYDDSLPALRKCIELATTKANSEGRTQLAHRIIAAILTARGVYDEAVSHAKQAIALDETEPWGYHELAKALNKLRRSTEAINAAKTGIRLSDGKWATMHFALGTAHFELKQWPEAVQAFEKAAELNPKDPVATFNAAAASYNNRSFDAALRWYRETQKRDATYEQEQVNQSIREILSR